MRVVPKIALGIETHRVGSGIGAGQRVLFEGLGGRIEARHLPPAFASTAPPAPLSPLDGVHLGVGTTVGEAERQLIVKTLESTHNNKTRAADILGISLKTLHNKLKEYATRES